MADRGGTSPAAGPVLVAGGTGALGSAVVGHLRAQGYPLRILSRRPPPRDLDPATEWAEADVSTGAGVAEAVAGVSAMVNCVGDARDGGQAEVAGAARLVEAGAQLGVGHLVHVSIVGIDRIDHAYYRLKQETESIVMAGGIPWSIQRFTQFHSLLHLMLAGMDGGPGPYVLPVAGDALFQPLDPRDAAIILEEALRAGPGGRLPDAGGPEVLTMEAIAGAFLEARGGSSPAFAATDAGFFPAATVEGFRQGYNTVPDNRRGSIRWAGYVREQRPAAASDG